MGISSKLTGVDADVADPLDKGAGLGAAGVVAAAAATAAAPSLLVKSSSE
jgi:hypothetical protein